MHTNATLSTACLLGSLVLAPAFANPQQHTLPVHAIIDEIRFVGLHSVPEEAAKSLLSFFPGEEFDSTRISCDLRTLNRLGWFQDVFVTAQPVATHDPSADASPLHFLIAFHVKEYPFLTAVEFTGSRILSTQQIEKMLQEKSLSPQVGWPANPVKLHQAAVAIQSELAAVGHPQASVSIRQQSLLRHSAKIQFQIHDGPRLPVLRVEFSGNPEIPDKILRKQMHQVSPGVWLCGLRSKNIYTQEKAEEDRLSLLAYLQDHGFPQAQVGTPQVTLEALSSRTLPWFHRKLETGLALGVPVEAGPFYTFGPTQLSPLLQQQLHSAKKTSRLPPDFTSGRNFSEHAVDSLRRNWELRLHRNVQRQKGKGTYRLRATSSFDPFTRVATVRFDFDSTPPYIVRHVDFAGNQRFPDRYLRRRIGLTEGQPLDDYALEAGLARLTRTGYFEPLKREDIQIKTYERTHTADVIVHLHEKGRQRISFSGGREQFGSTIGIAYTVFNLLGMNEFLSTQVDIGPETFQLAMRLAIEGVLGSRGTLAISVFDTFLRPRFSPAVQGPFERTRSEAANIGWSYAGSDADLLGIDYGLSHTLTQYSVNPLPGSTSGPQITNPQSDTSSHSVGIGWTHYSGEQKIQLIDSASGGILGGSEDLVRSKAEYGQTFPDELFGHHNSWAFRTAISAVGSYKGNLPPYALLYSGEDTVRGFEPGQLGPYETFATISPSGGTAYSAVPAGSDLVAASNLEYRFPLHSGFEGATFFDAGSGLLLPNWLGPERPSLLNSTNGLLHASTGLELRWTLPAVGIPLRINYSFNILGLNRSFLMPDGSFSRVRIPFGAPGWGLGPLF